MSGTILEGHIIEETEKQVENELRPPRKFKVILHNDDYTPMEFVVEILKVFFHKHESEANRIMLQVHEQGQGICGVFTRDVAETKVVQVNQYSQSHQHPLLCTMEAE